MNPQTIDVVVVDFDNTVFKRNKGAIGNVVDFLRSTKETIIVVTGRKPDQYDFIIDFFTEQKIAVAGIAFGSGKDNYMLKLEFMREIMQRFNVVLAIDDDRDVIYQYQRLGIYCQYPEDICLDMK